MLQTVLLFSIFQMCATRIGHHRLYPSINVTRSTVPGIAEYRSALTLDWLAAEDVRQREMALSFETEPLIVPPSLASDCMNYAKPASGKVARLMLELLKNLEGDESTLIPELIQSLIRTKLLVETSLLDAEPNLESLLHTPGVMMGEPYTTFPRVLAMTWMAASDPMIVNKHGWCPITRVARYLTMNKPILIARHMRNLDPVIARVRFIMEDFIQQVTPNMYDKKYEIEKRKYSRKSNFHRMKYTDARTTKQESSEENQRARLEIEQTSTQDLNTLPTLDSRAIIESLTGTAWSDFPSRLTLLTHLVILVLLW